MTKDQLHAQLVAVVTKGIARGPSAGRDVDPTEVLDRMIASDAAPEWDAVKVGREQLAVVIGHYRTL
jgi:hypothetical protein